MCAMFVHCIFSISAWYLVSGAGVTTQVEAGDWQVICMCAISILADIVQKILTGGTSMIELGEVEKRRIQLQKVCAAVYGHEETVNMPSVKDLDACVNQRLKEFEKFCLYREELSNVLLFLSRVKLQGSKCNSNFHHTVFLKVECFNLMQVLSKFIISFKQMSAHAQYVNCVSLMIVKFALCVVSLMLNR